MRSILSKAALAAAILTVSAASGTAAFAHGFHDGGCGHFCRTHWGGFAPAPVFGWPDYVDVVPPPVVVSRPVYVGAAPVPVTPVYVDVAQNPRLGGILRQIGADNRALDSDRAAGLLSGPAYWRLKGEAEAIRAETKGLDRQGGYVPDNRIAALQGETSRLTRSVAGLSG